MVEHQVRVRSDDDRTPVLGIVHLYLEVLQPFCDPFYDGPDQIIECRPVGRELDWAFYTVEQDNSELFFYLLKVGGDRWLPDLQIFGGPGDTVKPCNMVKTDQLSYLYGSPHDTPVWMISIIIQYRLTIC